MLIKYYYNTLVYVKLFGDMKARGGTESGDDNERQKVSDLRLAYL